MIVKVCDPRHTKVTAGGPGPAAKRSSDANLGRSMRGLVRYLVGPGENNEHTNPTLVAASGTLAPEWSAAIWDDPLWGTREVSDFARQLNAPMVEKRARGELGDDRAWVLHVVISMPPGDRLELAEWGTVAQEYVTEMGLDGSGGKAPTRWAAFHHGQSKSDCDHIHVAVNMIREDGTWANNYQVKYRSQQARRAIETAHGFTPAEQAARRRDVAAYTVNDAHKNSERVATVDPATGAAVNRRVYRETDIEKLRRLMSAAGAGADTEADYVHALWASGVLTRPRLAAGTREVVTGYAVSLRPAGGASEHWMGAGTVRRDLSLPNLRARWQDTPEAATAAAQAWRRYHDTSLTPPSRSVSRPGAAAEAAAGVAALGQHLQDLDPAKVGEWRRAADLLGGAYAAWTAVGEQTGRGAATRSMDALYRAAWRPQAEPLPARLPAHTGMARAVRLIAQAGGRDDALGWLAVLQQLELCVKRVAEAQQARREADEGAYLLANTHAGLNDLRRQIESHELQPATATPHQGASVAPAGARTTGFSSRDTDDRGR